MSNEKQKFETALTKVSNTYFPMIQSQLEDNSIEMDNYQKQCVMNSISAINNVLDEKGVEWGDKQLDQSNITEILLSVASLKLNPSASPNEVYFTLRNTKKKVYGKDVWSKKIEMGIEGDGNDAILSSFGRNIKQVMQFWMVREDDEFKYPSYTGLQMNPPEWTPKGTGKVVRIVYPIIKHGDIIEYHIGERADVIKNLIAHINNNLMNETFGIAKNRFNATAEQKQKIQEKKDEILEKVNELGLDGTLDNKELHKYISPAWKDLQSRESMIIRKIRNNIVKRIPKDFGNTLVEHSYDLSTNENRFNRERKEVNEQANSEVLEMDELDEPEEKEVSWDDIPEPEKPEEIKQEENKEQSEAIDHKGNDSIENFNISEDDVPF